jgi:hypothetical protein
LTSGRVDSERGFPRWGNGRHRTSKAIALLGVCGIVALVAWKVSSTPTERLGDARLFSAGASPDNLHEDAYAIGSIDEAPLATPIAFLPSDDQAFWAIYQNGNLEVSLDGSIEASIPSAGSGRQSSTITDTTIVSAVRIRGGNAFMEFVEITSPAAEHDRVELDEFDLWQEGRYAPPAVAALSDGSVLIARHEHAEINVLTPGRTELSRWVGQPGDDDAELELDEPLGEIVALLTLPDDRVLFVPESLDGRQDLYLIDDAEIHQVEADPGFTVDATDPPFDYFARPLQHLAHGPNGTVLVSGMVDNTYPRISLLDVDTGEVEVLIDLDEVVISSSDRSSFPDSTLSMVAVGDDLIFHADRRLWILEDAFDHG